MSSRFYISVILASLIIVAVCVLFSAAGLFLSGGGFPAFSDIAVSGEPMREKCVIIDAGHGGTDSGAISKNGTFEKDINLSISKMIASFLEADGIKVIMTRIDDNMLDSDDGGCSRKLSDLKGRVEKANAFPEALFISIHQNSVPFPSCRGAQVFFGDNPLSELLARKIQNGIRDKISPSNKRQIKKAGDSIFILDRIKSPAVLIECGFLSDPEESLLLADKEYQKKIAFVISRAVSDFFADQSNETFLPLTLPRSD